MKIETILIILALVAFGFVLFNPGLFTTTEQYAIIPSCGNNVCDTNNGENYSSCPTDCSFCGNNICEKNKLPSEHADNCLIDCHEGDKICQADLGENCGNSEDCGCGENKICSINKCIDITQPEEPKPNFFQQQLFKIGEFSVTGLTVIIALASLIILAFAVGK